jgi:hypothetical protein
MVMTIWKWSLTLTTMEGLLVKKLLLSYDESYIPNIDVERMIAMKKNSFSKRKWKEIVFVKFVSKI